MGYCFKALFVLIVAIVTYSFIQSDDYDTGVLKNKRVLITGASQNIGEELATQYAQSGAKIVITARREDKLKEVAAKCLKAGASSVDYIVADMADIEQVKDVVKDAVALLGGLDQLVLNHVTGLNHPGMWNNSQFNLDYAQNSAIVNYVSYIHLSTHAIPHLTESNGNLIVVSSLAGHVPTINTAIYGATKASLNHFYASLRLEMMASGRDPYSITICMMGPIETDRSRWSKFPDKVNMKGNPIDDTAAQIIKAGTTRRSYLFIPWWTKYASAVKAIPSQVVDRMFLKIFYNK
ncbi:hydroxysteroid 11-beta-dehydrogenase 1-like protein [Ciona intestinalis]